MDIKERIEKSPNSAGVYLLKDKDGAVIYIGKASSIKKRLKNHFKKDAAGRQRALIEASCDADYILTPDESTALLLEAALIKRYRPRYNVALRDDKSYPRLKLTLNEEYPRLFITRKLKPDRAVYFGPYTSAKLLRKALMFMRRAFPLRTCRAIPEKSCLNFHLGQCLAPCIDEGKKQGYLKVVEELRLFLDGEQEQLISSLSRQMENASQNKDYEKAAALRDRIKALSSVAGQPRKTPAVSIESFEKKPCLGPSLQIEQLATVLNLAKPPSVIEAFDVSNISGKEATGSMIYFKDGKPDQAQYRKFKIRTVRVIDDYSMLQEIISRRYRRLLDEKSAFPELIIVDGGKGHLAAAKNQLNKMGLWKIPVVSIAKNPDRIYASKDKEPITLGKYEGALFLVQRIRDEAHRFAIDYHRLLRRKQTSASELDNIEGVGPRRKARLIRHFGSLDEIKIADVEDLKKVKFISEKEAKAIYNYFH